MFFIYYDELRKETGNLSLQMSNIRKLDTCYKQQNIDLYFHIKTSENVEIVP